MLTMFDGANNRFSRCTVFCQDIVGKRHVSRQVFEREMYAFIGILERTVPRNRTVQIPKAVRKPTEDQNLTAWHNPDALSQLKKLTTYFLFCLSPLYFPCLN